MGFLTGKTAIITGAGRAVLSDGSCGSIGYGIATAFAKEGANLVITGRNVKKLEEAKNELEAKYGIRVLPVRADVCAGTDNEATVQNVVNQAVDTFGGIQVLVNNAQASASGVPLAEHTTEQFDLALYSGLYAAFYYMKACYPYLAKSKGSVINFASGAGLFGSRHTRMRSRPTSRCRPWATTPTPRPRSAGYACSWPCRTSSICPARLSRWRAAWVCARNCYSHSSSYMQKGLCQRHSPFCV